MEKIASCIFGEENIWGSNAIDCSFNEHIVKQFDLIKNEN